MINSRSLILGRLAVMLAAAVGLLAGPAAAIGSGARVRIGSPPRQPGGARIVGALAGGTQLSVAIALRPRDPAALERYADEVSTPGSSLFRRYQTVEQFRARFGPTSAELGAVDASLRAHGLSPGRVSANGLTIPVSASAGVIGHAFSLSFERLSLPGGRTAFKNQQAPLLDASVAGVVQGVVGLDTLAVARPLGLAAPRVRGDQRAQPEAQPDTSGPGPCPTAVAQAPVWDAYTADQVASAYQFSSLYGAGDEGAGQTIAVLELEPNLTSDIAAYQSCYGTSATVSYVKEDHGAGSGAGSGEAALDIEQAIGLAPEADVAVYQAPNTDAGLIDDYTAIVDSGAEVLSTSWGLCERDSGTGIMSEENTLFEEAATQGQSIFAAAGDNGSEDCQTDALAVDDPASQPYVTGVGGTTLSSTGQPREETVWNEAANSSGAGGGGISRQWSMPAYQADAPASLGVVGAASSRSVCGAAVGSWCREVPDVSADADPYTGYLIFYDGSWGGIGGTSAAAPLWAAFMALVNASSGCHGTPVGFANPALYEAAAGDYASEFNDITSGNNDYAGTNSGDFGAGSGYDLASGLGTPIGSTLPAALCGDGGGEANTVSVTAPANPGATVGSPSSLQIEASDSGGEPLSYTATGLPTGLSINSSTGLISGTPLAAGAAGVTVTATDSTAASSATSFTLPVAPAQSSIASTVNDAGTGSLWSGGERSGAAAYDSASVSGFGGTLTGTVSYRLYPNGSCAGPPENASAVSLAPNGVTESPSTGPLAAGTYGFQASYSGDANHLGSAAPCQAFAVSAPEASHPAIGRAELKLAISAARQARDGGVVAASVTVRNVGKASLGRVVTKLVVPGGLRLTRRDHAVRSAAARTWTWTRASIPAGGRTVYRVSFTVGARARGAVAISVAAARATATAVVVLERSRAHRS